MPVIFPDVPTAQGNVKVAFVTTMAIPGEPTVAELGAVGVVDASFIITEGNWAPSAEANRGTAPRRLGSKRQFESFGAVTEAIADLVYVVDPQAASGSDEKKLYELLDDGAELYAVERLGLDAETDAFAIGDVVNTYPIRVSVPTITGDTSDEFAEFIVTQAVAVRAPGAYRDFEITA